MTSQLVGGGASLCSTHRNSKIAAVHATAWRFDTEGLIEINFSIKAYERARTQLSITFKNFKITSLLTEI
jgi:hypothetical protein